MPWCAGATSTMTRGLRQRIRCCAPRSRHVAHYQIRNRGTVGGSLAHADPAAELPGIAVTCEAEITLVGTAGARVIKARRVLHRAAVDGARAGRNHYRDAPAGLARGPALGIPGIRPPSWRFRARCGIALFYDEDEAGKARNAHVGVDRRLPSAASACTEPKPPLNGQAIDEETIAQGRRPQLHRSRSAGRHPCRAPPIAAGSSAPSSSVRSERAALRHELPMRVQFEVNGKPVEVEVEPRVHLADCLRDQLRLTGTHLGCEHGVCGACTVIVDGAAVRSCLMLAVQAEGSKVTTVEGLSTDEALTPLQTAFRKHHALQCGFCTPGMLTTAHALLDRGAGLPMPTASARRCRAICAAAPAISPIVEAVLEARAAYRKDAARRMTGAMNRLHSSAARSNASRICAFCAAAANLSTTCGAKGCCMPRSCAAPSRMAASARIDVSRARALARRARRHHGEGYRRSGAARFRMRLLPLPGSKRFPQPVIAEDRVRYVGEPIAVVLADSAGACARMRLGSIDLDIEELPPVADRVASARKAALLFEEKGTTSP